MTDQHPQQPEPTSPWSILGKILTNAVEDIGHNLGATSALGYLLQGQRVEADAMLRTVPDDRLQRTVNAAFELAGLALIQGRGRGLDMHDPTAPPPHPQIQQDPRSSD